MCAYICIKYLFIQDIVIVLYCICSRASHWFGLNISLGKLLKGIAMQMTAFDDWRQCVLSSLCQYCDRLPTLLNGFNGPSSFQEQYLLDALSLSKMQTKQYTIEPFHALCNYKSNCKLFKLQALHLSEGVWGKTFSMSKWNLMYSCSSHGRHLKSKGF